MARRLSRGGGPPRPARVSRPRRLVGALPPLLIQVGSEEVLLDDARNLAARAEAAGVEAALEVRDGMIHVWHWFGEYLDEAKTAVERIAGFAAARLPA